MKRYAAVSLLALVFAAAPCQAQFLKKLEQSVLGGGGQGQQGMPGQQQPTQVGNVSLPPGQYIMTNTQTGQAFQITIQNGGMYLMGQQMQGSQQMMPGQGMMQQQQQGGMGGMMKGGLGSFLKNELGGGGGGGGMGGMGGGGMGGMGGGGMGGMGGGGMGGMGGGMGGMGQGQ